jgi:hypothetical protein
MRYQWSRLNRQQKGSFGEHFAKMEFAMYGFLVFAAEVDDRGIDFVARNERGNHIDVQVKTITGRNYTYIKKSKFAETLLVCLVILEETAPPEVYLFRGTEWNKNTEGLLSLNSFPNASEPEYGINITKARLELLERYRFDRVVSELA